jgi:hypothetical protein
VYFCVQISALEQYCGGVPFNVTQSSSELASTDGGDDDVCLQVTVSCKRDFVVVVVFGMWIGG